jgi:hypothetical protein
MSSFTHLPKERGWGGMGMGQGEVRQEFSGRHPANSLVVSYIMTYVVLKKKIMRCIR